MAGPTGPMTTAETADEQQTNKKTNKIKTVRHTGRDAYRRGDGIAEKDAGALARTAAGAASGRLGIGGLAETRRRGTVAGAAVAPLVLAAGAVVAPLVHVAGGILGPDPVVLPRDEGELLGVAAVSRGAAAAPRLLLPFIRLVPRRRCAWGWRALALPSALVVCVWGGAQERVKGGRKSCGDACPNPAWERLGPQMLDTEQHKHEEEEQWLQRGREHMGGTSSGSVQHGCDSFAVKNFWVPGRGAGSLGGQCGSVPKRGARSSLPFSPVGGGGGEPLLMSSWPAPWSRLMTWLLRSVLFAGA